MLKIKLSPRGKKHQITYRIIVTERRSKLNGKFIDDLGFYTPQTKIFEIDKKKLAQWQKNGAQLALGVDKLLNPGKYPNKKKTKKVKKESTQAPVKETAKNEKAVENKEEVKNETKIKVETKKEEKNKKEEVKTDK